MKQWQCKIPSSHYCPGVGPGPWVQVKESQRHGATGRCKVCQEKHELRRGLCFKCMENLVEWYEAEFKAISHDY